METQKDLKGNKNLRSVKGSLCRFYLRGLCDKSAKECQFAHGIHDLIYHPWQPGEYVEYDFQSNAVFCQKQSPTPAKNYLNLFEFQREPIHSLEEINQNRAVRLQIRFLFHRQQFKEFIELLQTHFQGILWTEEVLLREYTRVGFNKLMTRINFRHLQSFLLEGESPLYFKNTLIMPPSLRKQTVFYTKRASEEQIIHSYKKAYNNILEDCKELSEEELKRKLAACYSDNISIPSVQLYLKQKNMTIQSLLLILQQDQKNKILITENSQPSLESQMIQAKNYLHKNGGNRLISWNQVVHHLCQSYGLSKLKGAQNLKVSLCLEGYFYFHLPFTNFVFHHSFDYQFHNDKTSQCPCNLKSKFELDFPASQSKVIQGEVFDISSASQLSSLAPLFLNSEVVAVDLEGNLRKGGIVEMVQISNGQNIFLIDLLGMINNNDLQSVEYTKKVLRNLMAGPTVKIFHDCRQDSLALHELLETCLLNVFDTSAMEIVSIQHQQLINAFNSEGNKASQMKQTLQLCEKIKSPSLNSILIKYSSSNGPNTLKEYFHSEWSKGNTQLSKQRPLNAQFRAYCILDVIDLVEIYYKIKKGNNEICDKIGSWLSKVYAKSGYTKSNNNKEEEY